MTVLRESLLALALTGGIAGNVTGQSLQPGCYSREEMQAKLRNDNQQSIVIANRVTDHHPVNLFTSNAEGTLGYNVEGDQSYGTPSTKICVRAIYRDVRVADIGGGVIPSFVQQGEDSKKGVDLETMLDKGGRVIFGAQTFAKQANGQIVEGKQLIVVFLAPTGPDKLAAALAVSARGEATPLLPLQDMAVTQHLEALGRARGRAP